ncbi:MAG: MFS transporter [Planctomycetes bacterium]|nr:MFS transporter [Planctomycetota bacterium]
MDEASQPDSTATRRDFTACTGDGATYCLMVGSGETYFAALVLALGKSPLVGGLIATIPMLVGAAVQLASPAGLRHVGSPRKWIQGCSIVQALSFVPLIIAAGMGEIPSWLAFLTISIYWSAALGASPAWTTWVARLFPESLRAKYFSGRNRFCQIAQLSAMLGAGALLSFGERGGWQLNAFMLIMIFAALSRLSSVWFLHHQGDVKLRPADIAPVEFHALPARFARHGDLRILLCLIALQFAANVSGPFVNPWLLNYLKFDKASYLLIICTLFASKCVALTLLGGVIRKIGARRVLLLGTAGTSVGVLLLSLSSNLAWLTFVQVFSGFMWAAWELSAFLVLLESIRHSERTSMMALYNFTTYLAIAAGSFVGASVLEAMGTSGSAYISIFVLSGVLRLAVLWLRPSRVRPATVEVIEPALASEVAA